MNEPFHSLNLPQCAIRLRDEGQSKQIFDLVRRRFVSLTPEEWVRQHLIHFMVNQCGYPASLMAVEKIVKVNGLSQRADIVVYNRDGLPWLLAECKSASVTLTQDTFYQAARYSSRLRVPYYVLSNGMNNYCLHFKNDAFIFMENFPVFGS